MSTTADVTGVGFQLPIRNPTMFAMLRRVDVMSCVGCHVRQAFENGTAR
jgi:hypothetical protein